MSAFVFSDRTLRHCSHSISLGGGKRAINIGHVRVERAFQKTNCPESKGREHVGAFQENARVSKTNAFKHSYAVKCGHRLRVRVRSNQGKETHPQNQPTPQKKSLRKQFLALFVQTVLPLSFETKQEACTNSLGKLFAQIIFSWVHWGGCFLGGGFLSLYLYQRTPWGGGKKRGWKTSRMTPLPKRGFGPPLVRPPPSGVSALFFLFKNPRQSRPEALFLLEGSNIFGRVRSLVRFHLPPIARPNYNF